MAADLAATPASGLRVQLCGDAHLSNFGAFASPERRLVFDINDFGETLPGPFEWDVKRLAASLAVAGRDNGFTAKTRRKIVPAAAEGYRTAMRALTRQPRLDVWYAHLDIEQASVSSRPRSRRKRFEAAQGPPPHRRRAGEDRTTASFNPVRVLARVGVLALGRRLFERCLIAAGDLESIPVRTSGGRHGPEPPCRRHPVARAARIHAAGHEARAGTSQAGRLPPSAGARLCARTQVQRWGG